MSDLVLAQHVKWQEQYVSAGLNRKFSGVTSPGVYYGFELSAGGGMTLLVSPGEDFDYSVAVIERSGYNITVRSESAGTVDVPSTGTYYVCLDALYVPATGSGYQQIVFRASPEDYHVVLGKIVVPSGTTDITDDMISTDGRTEGSTGNLLLELMTMYTDVQTDVSGLDERLSNIENWAKLLTTEAYDPDTTYAGS